MAALRAGRVLYFFAVGGCREGVAIVAANDVVAHFFQFGFVGDVFKGVENCLYANDTLIGVVERQVECIWTQILSPLCIKDNTKFGKSQISRPACGPKKACVSTPFGGEVVWRQPYNASRRRALPEKYKTIQETKNSDLAENYQVQAFWLEVSNSAPETVARYRYKHIDIILSISLYRYRCIDRLLSIGCYRICMRLYGGGVCLLSPAYNGAIMAV